MGLNAKSPYWDPTLKAKPSKRRKAGVLFYDPTKKTVLMVQTYGLKWGPPKGDNEQGETIYDTAIREVREETGIQVSKLQLLSSKKINLGYVSGLIFLVEVDSTKYKYPAPNDKLEITGIRWLRVDCIFKNTLNGVGKKCLEYIRKLSI